MENNIMFSSNKNDWETPMFFYKELDKEFCFTLDPCSNADNHKCNEYFTKEQDGLKQDWSGHVVFCNPPYGRKSTGEWIEKCAKEADKPNTTVVMLIPARTDTIAFHKYIYGKAEIRFIKGRLRFVGAKYTAPFPSMVVVFRTN